MLQIPLLSTPNQTLNCSLGGQYCTINLYTLGNSLFLDLNVNELPIVQGVLCLNSCLIVREPYLGFVGDLTFVDTQGTNDPDYTGLGGRYQLQYFEVQDMAGLAL